VKQICAISTVCYITDNAQSLLSCFCGVQTCNSVKEFGSIECCTHGDVQSSRREFRFLRQGEDVHCADHDVFVVVHSRSVLLCRY
jgi:hypothetical protein